MGLTNVDKKVLNHILINGFNDYSSLARDLRISPSTAMYSVRKMVDQGYLLGFRIRANPFALGFNCSVLFLTQPKFAKESYELMDKFHLVKSSVKSMILTGAYTIADFSLFKDYTRFGEGMREVLDSIGGRLLSFTTIPVVDVIKIHHTGVWQKDVVRLSKIDRDVLRYIVLNPMTSISRMAEDLGISRNTASRSASKLWEKQVLLKRSVVLPQSTMRELGFTDWALVFMNIPNEDRDMRIREIASIPEVHELYTLSSYYDLLAIIRGESTSSIARILRNMLEKDLVTRTDTRIILSFKEKETSDIFNL